MELNSFSDLSIEEFTTLYTSGLKINQDKQAHTHLQAAHGKPVNAPVAVPDSVDWNALGKVSVPQN